MRLPVPAAPLALLAALLPALPLAAPLASAGDTAPDALVVDGNADLDRAHGVTEGRGSAADPFVLADLAGFARLEVRNVTAHLVIRDLVLGQQGRPEFLGSAIHLARVANVSVEGVQVWSFRVGVEVESSRGVEVRDSTFQGQVFHAVLASGGSGLSIVDNTIRGTQAAGIAVHGAQDVRLEQNRLDHAGKNRATLSSSILVEGGKGLVLSGNAVADGGGSGVFLDAVEGFRVDNNTVAGQRVHGLWLHDSSGGEVVDNRAEGNGGNGLYLCKRGPATALRNLLSGNGVGIDATEYQGAVVANNTVEGSLTYGMQFLATRDSRVEGNQVLNQSTRWPALLLEGDRNQVANNSVEPAGPLSFWLVAGQGNTLDGQPWAPQGPFDEPGGKGGGGNGVPAPALPLAAAGLLAAAAARRGQRASPAAP